MENGTSNRQTTVEDGTELKGTLKSTCPVVVKGKIDGQIDTPSLTVTASGTVMGEVKAETIRSDGVLAGNIDARDISLSGTVRNDTVIKARNLEVKLTHETGKLQVTFGEVALEVGDEPAVRPRMSERPKPAESASDTVPPASELERALAAETEAEVEVTTEAAPEESQANGKTGKGRKSKQPDANKA